MATRVIKYKCPFCDEKYNREDLVNHIEENHPYDIPEDFTAFRYVFNYVNKKPITYHGKCTECGGPTDWDENKGRYNRQCNKKSCHDSYIRKFEANMMKTRGVTRISATAAGQVQMLANRKISGEYKFSNGQVKTYTGSYELHALEFMDKVMHILPDDLMCPGPILEYSLNGNTHIYITDFYYQPYNLIIEVKDGGDNPNKRNMPEYRAKQIAKEKYIIQHTNYNYLRLTNNNLNQLLAVFANLKMQMVENTGDRVIHINEAYIDRNISDNKIGSPYFIYGNNGVPNCCVNIKGFTHPFRARSTMIPLRIRNGRWEIYAKYHKDYDNKYQFPGGGWNPNEDPQDAGAREAQEEARITVKNPLYCGDMFEYSDKVDQWVRDNIPEDKWWYGYYTKIYVGMFKSAYKGKIEEVDKDPDMLSGQWYDYASIRKEIFGKYNEAIKYYINEYNKNHKTNPVFIDIREASDYSISPIAELMSPLMQGKVVGLKDSDAYIINNIQNNVFSNEDNNLLITNGRMDSIFGINKDGILSKLNDESVKIIKDNISTFYKLGDSKDISKKIKPYIGKKISEAKLYETITGIKLYDYDQIKYNLESINIPYMDIKLLESYLDISNNAAIEKIIEDIREVAELL